MPLLIIGLQFLDLISKQFILPWLVKTLEKYPLNSQIVASNTHGLKIECLLFLAVTINLIMKSGSEKRIGESKQGPKTFKVMVIFFFKELAFGFINFLNCVFIHWFLL